MLVVRLCVVTTKNACKSPGGSDFFPFDILVHLVEIAKLNFEDNYSTFAPLAPQKHLVVSFFDQNPKFGQLFSKMHLSPKGPAQDLGESVSVCYRARIALPQ